MVARLRLHANILLFAHAVSGTIKPSSMAVMTVAVMVMVMMVFVMAMPAML